ncbi:MAG TPA: response regulator [Verrucomicrobiae bacterium]|jgi:CheY-like chemotaxis protein|nr:response regulator [Verrucomicrobiae bacterium]
MSNALILLVEDNEDDVFLMKRAMKKAGLDFPLRVAANGQEALDYLSFNGPFADAKNPPPSLVFLDLKLPYVHGFEVLRWIRENLPELPVVMLTSSNEERDRHLAAELGAVAYLVKPPVAETLAETMRFLKAPERKN